MKAVSMRRVQVVLRKRFGLRPLKCGTGTGHELWVDQRGRTCHPVFRKKDVPLHHLYCLGSELESKGIALRTEFLAALRST